MHSTAIGKTLPFTQQCARIMKLIALFLVLGLLQVAAKSTAQVTLKENAASLEKVLLTIKEKSGFDLFFDRSILKVKAKPVTVTVNNVSVEEALKQVFIDQPELTYTLEGKIISVKEKPVAVKKDDVSTFIAPPTVHGRVTNEKGEPVAGVNIAIKGGKVIGVTDDNGEFILNNVPDNAVLVFSAVSIQTLEMKLNGRTELALISKTKVNELHEVIINKGYYATTQKLNTGNVTSISGEELRKQPISDPILALQGRVPGLQIAQSSGIPGAKLNVQLRGRNSLRVEANNPLFIIDGTPFPSTTLTNSSALRGAGDLSPFASINMDDIESIEVLKDADATAIYGSRGANGVILITTKKSRIGKTKFNLNFNSGFGKVTNMLDLLNTREFLDTRHEAFANDNQSPQSWDSDINGDWDTTRFTNWQKLMIGNTTHFTNAQVSMSGGNSLMQYLIGGSFRKETTVFAGDYNDNKSSAYVNISNSSENKKFKSNLSACYVNDNNLLPTEDFTNYIFLAPDAPQVYNLDGTLNWANDTWINPFASLQKQSRSITTNLIGNLNLSYMLLPHLEIKAGLGYNKIRMEQSLTTPLTAYSPSAAANSSLRVHQFGDNNVTTWNIEPQITYNHIISRGKLEALIGATFQETITNTIAQTASGFISDALIDNIAAAGSITINNVGYTQYRYSAAFGRISYNWDDKYLINLTGRRDGSSRFGSKKQFGNFAAAGLGWIFSNEGLIKENLSFLSYGKLRGSYGTTGNDQLQPYQYLSTYTSYSNPYLGSAGLLPSRLANPYFGWEMVKKLEFGLDLGFLNDKILFSASYYRNRTDNQLVGYALPVITGFASVQANLPAVIENKGLEFELKTSNIKAKEFAWTSSINISFPKNKLIAFPNLIASSYSTQYEVGKSLFASKKFQYLGVDPQTGTLIFQDVNGDGSITSASDRISTKENTQKYFGGFINSFSYKGLSIDIFIQFVKQTGFVYLWNGFPGAGLNQPTTILNRWRKPGDATDIQKLSQDFGSQYITALSNFSSSDGQIGDASFIRLKNISLSYSLPHKWIEKLRLSQAKFFVNAQNLLTITNYKGLDPETQSILSLPPIKMIAGGVQIGF